MHYDIRETETSERTLMAVHEEAHFGELPATIHSGFDTSGPTKSSAPRAPRCSSIARRAAIGRGRLGKNTAIGRTIRRSFAPTFTKRSSEWG
jgi:hypothetical protein